MDERPQTILEAESGANDPISIALMVGLLSVATGDGSWGGSVGETLVRQLGIGLAVGVVGAWLVHRPFKYLTEPRETLQPIVALAAAGLVFGMAAAADGSGFLAVFALVAGLDDARRIYGLGFVVVAASVLVQGTTIPAAARRLGVTRAR